LSQYSSILSSFHGHDVLGVSVEGQATLIYGQIWGKVVKKLANHIKEPYSIVKQKNECIIICHKAGNSSSK